MFNYNFRSVRATVLKQGNIDERKPTRVTDKEKQETEREKKNKKKSSSLILNRRRLFRELRRGLRDFDRRRHPDRRPDRRPGRRDWRRRTGRHGAGTDAHRRLTGGRRGTRLGGVLGRHAEGVRRGQDLDGRLVRARGDLLAALFAVPVCLLEPVEAAGEGGEADADETEEEAGEAATTRRLVCQ